MLINNTNYILLLKASMINLFEVLPDTFIQESLATRTIYENFEALYELNNEVRLSLLDLLNLHKLKLFDGIVYAFGWNLFGQLGTSDTSDKKIPTPIDFSTITDEEGKMKRVTQISAGGLHSLILCEDGTVYSFGNNAYGQLGNGTSDNIYIRATEIDTSNIGSKRVIQVSAGNFLSLILCEDGTVYSFGKNKYGELGIGNTDNVAIPTKINTTNIGNKKVIQVAAGNIHSLILCEDGTVYSFGNNYSGELGTGNTDDVSIPTEIDTTNIGDKRVIQVSAGGFHSLILCEDGAVFSFGWNSHGQLGIGNTDDEVIPTPINTTNIGSKRVIQISAGDQYSLILCEDGTVYSFGWNNSGQLGNGTSGIINNTEIPTLINTLNIGSKRVIQISAGCGHSLILCEDNTVYSFGHNIKGQLGNGTTNITKIPTLVICIRVVEVSAGGTHSLVLT